MKTFLTLVSIVSILLLVSFITYGQDEDSSHDGIFHKGNWELNFSASIGNLSTTSSSSGPGSYSSTSNEKTSSMFYVQLGVIPAYFFTDGFSFEPEINVLIQSQEGVESKPGLSFLGNLAYSFNLPNKNFAPFIRAGYGISNSIQIPAVIGGLGRVSDKLDVAVLNAGAGIKVLVFEKILIGTELNYRRYRYSREMSSYYSVSYNYSITSVSGVFGFSILL